ESAKNRQGRYQERERVEDRLPAWIPRLQAQPEPQSDHGVAPGDHKHREWKPATQRIGYEIRVQHVRVIADIGAIEGVGDARLEDVIREEKRNREAEHELGCFGERHLERASQPERPERQAVVDRERAVEEDAAEGRRPILVDVLEGEIHDLDRDEAQTVVYEMGRHVCQHAESRSHPQSSDHAFPPRPSSHAFATYIMMRSIKALFPECMRAVPAPADTAGAQILQCPLIECAGRTMLAIYRSHWISNCSPNDVSQWVVRPHSTSVA